MGNCLERREFIGTGVVATLGATVSAALAVTTGSPAGGHDSAAATLGAEGQSEPFNPRTFKAMPIRMIDESSPPGCPSESPDPRPQQGGYE